ncbi:NADH-quinone oxidoreductase subunit A [Sphingobacterium corticis]|uniref:NADH-quinone oxidoreductase subunit A n=1 Tax=Sphingobacterium corticis TaxID=1812823 RepID=A0ABW5NEY1_9SPHI
MDDPGQLSEYGKILSLAIVGLLLVGGTIFTAKLISPKRPNSIKLSTYECGEEAIGTSWVQFNPRFYVVALIFLLFDVELIFIFPWATVFGNAEFIALDNRWGWFTLIEMAIFLGILIVGLVYVWKNDDLNWVKPRTVRPQVNVAIPASAYDKLNAKSYAIRDYKEIASSVATEEKAPKTSAPKPAFKPRFRKADDS